MDVGTTTVVAQLVDLNTGRTVDVEARYNSQMQYGEDYIARIMYAREHNALEVMQRTVVGDINHLVNVLVRRNRIALHDIVAILCSGNTAMIHFLIGLDPLRIQRAPYVPSANHIPPIRAAQVGIRINGRGLLYTLPSVGAYVGSDITAGVAAIRFDHISDLSLYVDIGTNGEVVLGNKEWMVCCSASAGPAFEGSGVRHGMRAARGAIERLKVFPDGRTEFETIGKLPPRGLCGSGLLDALAWMLRAGILDRRGTLQCRRPQRARRERRPRVRRGPPAPHEPGHGPRHHPVRHPQPDPLQGRHLRLRQGAARVARPEGRPDPADLPRRRVRQLPGRAQRDHHRHAAGHRRRPDSFRRQRQRHRRSDGAPQRGSDGDDGPPRFADVQMTSNTKLNRLTRTGTEYRRWSCEHLPYLVEFDNFGRSRTPNVADPKSFFVWGWDEISWFSLQPEEYRNKFLVYAYNWLKQTDPNGHLQMPVSRMLSCPNESQGNYRANTKSPTCPIGYSQEETIKRIWNEARQ